MEHNQGAFNVEAEEYGQRTYLLPPERRLFEKYSQEIATGQVLDLGVGGGRTTRYLLSRCRSYRAIDYAPAMIDACRRNFPECGPDAFQLGDARHLTGVESQSVDVALFAYNGLDYVGHDDRLQILSEIARVLRLGGLFLFSTHSLHAFPFQSPELQERNRHVDVSTLAERGWALLVDYATLFVTYYSNPEVQVAQLRAAGFETLDVLDMEGRDFEFAHPPADWMVHIACRRI